MKEEEGEGRRKRGEEEGEKRRRRRREESKIIASLLLVMSWLHHSTSILLRDVSTGTLGAVYDDDVSLTSCLELLQETGVDIRNVACPKCLQYHPLHRGLEERAHLEGEGEIRDSTPAEGRQSTITVTQVLSMFSYTSHSQGLSTEEGEPKSSTAIFPFTPTPSHFTCSHPHTSHAHTLTPSQWQQSSQEISSECPRSGSSLCVHQASRFLLDDGLHPNPLEEEKGEEGEGEEGEGEEGEGEEGEGEEGEGEEGEGEGGEGEEGKGEEGKGEERSEPNLGNLVTS